MTDTYKPGSSAAQLRRFLTLEDILIGHPDGIDGPRLAAGLTWARHGSTTSDREALIGLFASRPQAALDEGEWNGDPIAEGEKDLEEATAAAAAIADTPDDKLRMKAAALEAQLAATRSKLTISRYMSDRYRSLIEAHTASGATLLGRAAAQQLAIISLNLGRWRQEGPDSTRFTFPEMTFSVATCDAAPAEIRPAASQLRAPHEPRGSQ